MSRTRSNISYARRAVAFFDGRFSWRSFALEKSRDARSGRAVDPHLLPIKMSAAITSLTLTKEDLLLLIKSEVLDAKLKDLPSLKSHLDSCRADRVRARIVDCSGCLVYKTDMVYSALSGVPSVGRLRSELTAHFEQVEASYRHKVQEAINTLSLGQRVDEDHLLKTDGSGLGTFSRSPICAPGPGGGHFSLDATRFLLDGVTFRWGGISASPFFRGPVVGEFFISNGNTSIRKTEVYFMLRNANFDPTLRHGGRPRSSSTGEEYNMLHLRWRFHSPLFGPQTDFSTFSQYVKGAVRVRDDSLELVLGSELFEHRITSGSWVATFSSVEVKKRFVEFVEILELARKIAIEEPGSQHLGLNIGNIVTRIMHKSEILRRLEEPHRTNFDNNDWWYLTRNYADLAFSLMAAESVDEDQNKVLSDNHTSLVDLIGAPEVLPDEDGEDERLIQLRITTQGATQGGH